MGVVDKAGYCISIIPYISNTIKACGKGKVCADFISQSLLCLLFQAKLSAYDLVCSFTEKYVIPY